jgi:hypothetical protein
MSTRLVVGIAALAGGSVSAIISAVVHLEMLGTVNASLPAERQFAEAWWHAGKTQRLHREYRTLFPGGGLVRKWWIAVASALFSMLICAWSLGFFGF